MVKEVKRYVADDGEVFLTKQDAEAHEAKAELRELVDYDLHLRGREVDQRIGRDLVVSFLLRNAEDLHPLLNRISQPK